MQISMYGLAHASTTRGLRALDAILDKAVAFAEAKKIDPAVLINARLAPDMFPLVRQVQIACDFGKSIPSRLAGVDVPAYDDSEQTFAELQGRIARTLAFIDGIDPAGFEGSETRPIVLRPGTPKERSLDGQAYLLGYGLPQFFFHVTTAYDLLRHAGVELVKKDYLGRK
jgi:hypothetical protein